MAVDASSDIQSTVTRLLQHTKQLLESLTLWSRNQTTEETVSDVYVQLGNEFNLACRKFLSAGVDVADLGDVPYMLRVILERALAEEASEANLEQYLPQIREIIVNLLRQLKHKQTLLRQAQMRYMASQPRSQAPSPTGSQSQGPSPPGPGHGPTSGTPTSAAAAHVYPRVPRRTGSSSSTGSNQASVRSGSVSRESSERNIGSVPGSTPPNARGQVPMAREPRESVEAQRESQRASTIPENLEKPPERDSLVQPKVRGSPLAQLQRHGALERAASKRFSSHHLSRMMNGATAEQTLLPTTTPHRSRPADFMDTSVHYDTHTQVPLPRVVDEDEGNGEYEETTDNDKTLPPESKLAQSSQESNQALPVRESQANSPAPSSPSQGVNQSQRTPRQQETVQSQPTEITVFLRMGDRVRKTSVVPPPSLPALRLKFVDMFEYMPSADAVFPEMTIQDPQTGVDYELTQATIGDVRDGSLLCLKVPREPTGIEAQLADLQQGIKELMGRNLAAKRSPAHSPVPPSQSVMARKGPIGANSTASTPTLGTRRLDADQVEQLRKEVAVVRQVSTRLSSALRAEIAILQSKVAEMRQASTGQVSRSYMAATKQRLDGDNQRLLSLVDDLQDVIDAQRVAAAQRGIVPTPKQLEAVRRDLGNARAQLGDLRKFVDSEEPTWRQTWEAELNTVIEEQKWVTLQKEILGDLATDIDRAGETFELVEQVASDPPLAHRGVPHIVPIPPGQEQQVASAVLNEISALQPNHDQRLEAARRTERLRERELQLRTNEFEDELGTFVGDKRLRQIGGIEEVERRRQERDAMTRELQRKHDGEAAAQKEMLREERRRARAEERAREHAKGNSEQIQDKDKDKYQADDGEKQDQKQEQGGDPSPKEPQPGNQPA